MNSREVNEMTRILSGEASMEERNQFYEILEANPDKKYAFELMEKEWVAASDAMLYKSLDVEEAWQRHKSEFLGMLGNKRKSSFGYVLKWAAVLVVAVGVALYFISNRMIPGNRVISYSTGSNQTMPVAMTDGSTVTLNQNSTLDYNFDKEMRKVNFSGEAYFEVAADPDRPFIIEMGNAYIKVVGTAFNVKSTGTSVDVVVKEGVVEFGLKDRSEMTLISAGTTGKLSGNNLSKLEFLEPNSISWFTRELVFDQSPLTNVLTDISNTYHVNFQYDDNKLKDCRLTADFRNEELTDVLETLHTIFKVEFKKSENTYIVSGQACEVQ